ncbi:glycosyltransferase [Arthrobacter sp. EpRS71]|uniref:glycosyltransferase n=1 Tax=Arthrobacter sp. EpRS71 TaxID=1743141 RepID=UPI0007463A43|nr:glycosyltransferase [Arthrobacter sp. EpRS71]KUM34597.1 dolichyl-phosphate beta-glucosyltransferase [Arthrobacter sp. EpRS71]
MTLTDPRPALHQQLQRSPVDTRSLAPVLDIAIPVSNQETRLEGQLRGLHGHLMDTFPHTFRITVADNASTDSTLRIAERLARELPEIKVVHLDHKGRGNSLRRVWLSSPSPLLAYVDLDLPLDLSAVAPLVAPLISGHSDLAVGTRLARGAQGRFSHRRGLVARAYNVLLRVLTGARFSDAECGFKAIRADVAHKLLPHTGDDAWFFDTELLIIAERCALRIHEVPLDWTDDPDSGVDVVRTFLTDLKRLAKLTRKLHRGTIPIDGLRAELGRGAQRR